MAHLVIYDGNCNLCANLVQLLERLDRGTRFVYAPMQDTVTLAEFAITPADCEQGMIVLDLEHPEQRSQGSAAAEAIGQMLPGGAVFVSAYRALPGMKGTGDRLYAQVRDNRYKLFGQRSHLYQSAYPNCSTCPSFRA